MSRRFVFWLACVSGGLTTADYGLTEEPAKPARLRIAFASNREHYWYPRIVVYDHDGHSQGQVWKVLSSPEKRLDHQPTLNSKGTICIYGWEAEGGVGQLQRWNLEANASFDLGEVGKSPAALFSPSLSADGNLLAFTAWRRAGASNRWDVHLWDLEHGQALPLPGLNHPDFDERRVSLSGDGRCLAFTTNARDGRGLTDIWMYDRISGQTDRLPEMNSPAAETYPSLSHDGRLLAFVSDRAEGRGGMDVYLFDRQTRTIVDLPELNSVGQEQSVSLSGSGRYLAFVSERFEGAGEQDVFLYDRQNGGLLTTPGLNTDRDEYDPFLIEFPESVAASADR